MLFLRCFQPFWTIYLFWTLYVPSPSPIPDLHLSLFRNPNYGSAARDLGTDANTDIYAIFKKFFYVDNSGNFSPKLEIEVQYGRRRQH